MQKFTTLWALALAIACALPADAQDENIIFDLRTSTDFNSCYQTSLEYERVYGEAWSFSSYYGYAYMYNTYIQQPYYSDYLFTPTLDLTAGTLYRINIAPYAYSVSYLDGSLTVLLGAPGQIPAKADQWEELQKWTGFEYVSSTAEKESRSIYFTVPTDGQYRVAFLGEDYPIALWDTYIVAEGPATAPRPVTDFSVLADPTGAANVTVSFTMPTKNLSDETLPAELTYVISRDGVEVHSATASTGASVTWTDEQAPASTTATYSVVVKNGDDVSAPVSGSVYVGLDTPTAPTDLAVVTAGHSVTISWAAPATGINGNTLDPQSLRYTVTRIQGDESTVVASDLAATEFSETLEFSGLITVKYSITASLGSNTSQATTTSDIIMGLVELPLVDSFAGAKFADFWTAEILSGSYNWEVASASSSPSGTPVDADGGLAIYKSNNARESESARLMTPSINHATAPNPVVEYYMCHHSSGADVLKLQISIDGGDWIDVPGSENSPKKDGFSSGQWEKCTVALSDVIPADCSSFRVAFTAVSAWGYNIVIDAVRIYSLRGKDLAITSIAAPETAISGNDATITITVANNSAADVAAADYSVALTHSFPGTIADVTTVDVPALGTADITLTVPVTAIEALTAQAFTIKAELTFDGDEDPANNVSEEATVALAFLDLTPATNLVRGKDTADGLPTISWTPAQNPEYVPVNISESFEDFEKGDPAPYNGFVVLDLDGKAGSNCYSASGSILVVTTPSAAIPGNPDGTKVLGVTCAGNVQQDDWLISPAIACSEGSSINMSFLIGFMESTSITNKFEVLYSTGEYDPANPAAAFTNVVQTFEADYYSSQLKADYNLHQVTLTGIPAEAKYIAVHLNTKTLTSFNEPAVWLDNISITEAIEHPLAGYRVYDLAEGPLNQELLPTSQTSFTLPASDAARNIAVVAVYPEGEATPSNTLAIDAPTPDFEIALTAPESHTVGNNLTLNVAIANNSGQDLNIDGENLYLRLECEQSGAIISVYNGTLANGQQYAGTIPLYINAIYHYFYDALSFRLVLAKADGTELAATELVTVTLQYANHSAPEQVTLFYYAEPKIIAWNALSDSQGGALLGYNVYASTSFEALNTEIIPASTTTFTLTDELFDEEATFLVCAVFQDGESPLTAAVKSSGIIDLNAADAADAEYYNLQGIRVAQPTPGTIYIVRRGTTATKHLAK